MHVLIYPSNDISGCVCLLRHNYWRSHRIRSVRFAFHWLEKSVVFTIRRPTEPSSSIPVLYKSRDTRLCVEGIFSATYHACALMYNPYPRLTTPRSACFDPSYMYVLYQMYDVSHFAKDATHHRNMSQSNNTAIIYGRKNIDN